METTRGGGFDLIGQLVEGRYRIESLLGRGGMGSVFLANDERMGRRVVVKVPHALLALDASFVERFEFEIRKLTQLEHVRIVKVLDQGRIGDIPCAVLQYLPGGSLKEHWAPPVTPRSVLAWLEPVAEALDFVHRQRVIHRDVKPGNILFDAEKQVYLADFGIAKALGDEDTRLTQSGASPGSPSYMPPEAGRKRAMDQRYDQYSLAVVVYEALAGALPHQGDTSYEMLEAKNRDPPRVLHEVAAPVPAVVEAVVSRALTHDPAGRFGSCLEFSRAYREACERAGSAADQRPQRLAAPPEGAAVQGLTGLGTMHDARNPAAIAGPGSMKAAMQKARWKIAAGAAVLVLVLGAVAWKVMSAPAKEHEENAGEVVTIITQQKLPPVDPPPDPIDNDNQGESKPTPVPAKLELVTIDPPPGRIETTEQSRLIKGQIKLPATGMLHLITKTKGTPDVVLTDVALTPESDGNFESVLSLPKKEGNYPAFLTGTGGDQLAEWLIVVDHTSPVIHPSKITDDRNADSGKLEVEFHVELDASEPVTLYLESDSRPAERTNLGEFKSGPNSVFVPLPNERLPDRKLTTLKLHAEDRAGNKADFKVEVQLYSAKAHTQQVKKDRPHPPTLDAPPKNLKEQVEACEAWMSRVEHDPLVHGIEREDLLTPDFQAQVMRGRKEFDEWEARPTRVIPRFTSVGKNDGRLREYRHDETGLEFVLVPGGTFTFGSPPSDRARATGENVELLREREVVLSSFLIAKQEVTQGIWKRVMGAIPTGTSEVVPPGDQFPVTFILFEDVVQFCEKSGLVPSGKGVEAIPTEAQWEVACRAGSTGIDTVSPAVLNDTAWYADNSDAKAHKVGGKSPNGWGLYDMLGNVAEWCRDFYGIEGPAEAPTIDPAGPMNGEVHVRRGGRCDTPAKDLRPWARSTETKRRGTLLGFRPAITVPEK